MNFWGKIARTLQNVNFRSVSGEWEFPLDPREVNTTILSILLLWNAMHMQYSSVTVIMLLLPCYCILLLWNAMHMQYSSITVIMLLLPCYCILLLWNATALCCQILQLHYFVLLLPPVLMLLLLCYCFTVSILLFLCYCYCVTVLQAVMLNSATVLLFCVLSKHCRLIPHFWNIINLAPTVVGEQLRKLISFNLILAIIGALSTLELITQPSAGIDNYGTKM